MDDQPELYIRSGGESKRLPLTIKIHKKPENGDSLAPFSKLSETLPGGKLRLPIGNGSLGGLLKDKYTIKEKKAPEGYIPPQGDC